MKLFINSIIFLVSILSLHAQSINWMSMNEALEAQKDEPRKIIVDVYTNWCGPCKLMDKRTFSHPEVAKYINKHFYAVKFNAEGTEEITYKDYTYKNIHFDESRSPKQRNGQHLFANALKVSAYPTVVFFDENSDVISPVVGYKTPQQLELYLKMIATDKYAEITTQEAWKVYQENFTSTF